MDVIRDDKMPEIIKVDNNDDEDSSEPYMPDEGTSDKVALVGPTGGHPVMPPFSRAGGALGLLFPYMMVGMMLGGGRNSPFGGFGFGGGGNRIPETLSTRKCALPECDVHFTPERKAETCCSKEHFIILRDMQKLKDKIHTIKKKNKYKRKRK